MLAIYQILPQLYQFRADRRCASNSINYPIIASPIAKKSLLSRALMVIDVHLHQSSK